MEPRIAKTLENLRANGFQALYFASKEEATTWLCQQVQRGEKVAFGGSVTLRELHLRESLEQKGALFLDPYATKDPKKQREMLDEKLTEIKSVLSEVYGTDPAHIMVEISE